MLPPPFRVAGGAAGRGLARSSHGISPRVQLGLEFHAELGTTRRILPASEQIQVLFLAVDTYVEDWGLNFGIGRGLTKAADELTLKAMVSVPF